METIYINSVEDYNRQMQQPTLHQWVSVGDFSLTKPVQGGFQLAIGLYCVYLKYEEKCNIKYGREKYDYQTDTLTFFAPNQLIEVAESPDLLHPKGVWLVFHPDFIKGTTLGRNISNYHFFGYATHEALHISAEEKALVLDCFQMVKSEIERPSDKYSKKLIITNIELFLSYCQRFYDRQFISRKKVNQRILQRFDQLLENYFYGEKHSDLPSVAFCANELHLSPNYFGDLIRKEAGKSAQEYIQHKIIDFAKEQLLNTDKNISEVSDNLGFKHISSFTRLFKKIAGVSPNEYRKQTIK